MRKIQVELVRNLKAELKKAKKPEKRMYSRREALEELKPAIDELRRKGFEFEQIAELITQKSDELLKASGKELSALFRGEKTEDTQDIKKAPDTPSPMEAEL